MLAYAERDASLVVSLCCAGRRGSFWAGFRIVLVDGNGGCGMERSREMSVAA